MSSQTLSDLIRSATPSAGGGGGPLPADTYTGIVASIEVTKASTGSSGWKVVTKVTEGEFAGKDIWDFIYVTERSVGVVLSKMLAYGATQDAVADALLPGNETGQAILAQQVIDSPVSITVVLDEYNGKTRNKVKNVQKGEAAANPLASPAPAAAPAAVRPTSPF